jgi:glycosyltransferase involved in cell wall biosynthesis
MKGLFIIFEGLSEHNGISKKIIAQKDGFLNNGIDIKLSSLVFDKTNSKRVFSGRTVEKEVIDRYSDNVRISNYQRLTCFNGLLNYIKSNGINFIYIRYIHIANYFFINFLVKLKEMNVLVLLEIPTYPYDLEYKNVGTKQRLLLSIEKKYRKKFNKYVYKIITFQNYDSIFGVETIKISNGIDISKIPMPVNVRLDDALNLIGVAGLNYWHGFDRLIEGLNIYYSSNPKRVVFFHIVGDTNNIIGNQYKNLVTKYNLESYVIFYDNKIGDELDEVYEKCQFGIGSLGIHRIGISEVKPLKSREYCARGIPFVYSFKDEDFDDKSFILKESPNDSPIDINRLIDFYYSNNFNNREIRRFAEENLTWDVQVKRILEQLKFI